MMPDRDWRKLERQIRGQRRGRDVGGPTNTLPSEDLEPGKRGELRPTPEPTIEEEEEADEVKDEAKKDVKEVKKEAEKDGEETHRLRGETGEKQLGLPESAIEATKEKHVKVTEEKEKKEEEGKQVKTIKEQQTEEHRPAHGMAPPGATITGKEIEEAKKGELSPAEMRTVRKGRAKAGEIGKGEATSEIPPTSRPSHIVEEEARKKYLKTKAGASGKILLATEDQPFVVKRLGGATAGAVSALEGVPEAVTTLIPGEQWHTPDLPEVYIREQLGGYSPDVSIYQRRPGMLPGAILGEVGLWEAVLKGAGKVSGKAIQSYKSAVAKGLVEQEEVWRPASYVEKGAELRKLRAPLKTSFSEPVEWAAKRVLPTGRMPETLEELKGLRATEEAVMPVGRQVKYGTGKKVKLLPEEAEELRQIDEAVGEEALYLGKGEEMTLAGRYRKGEDIIGPYREYEAVGRIEGETGLPEGVSLGYFEETSPKISKTGLEKSFEKVAKSEIGEFAPGRAIPTPEEILEIPKAGRAGRPFLRTGGGIARGLGIAEKIGAAGTYAGRAAGAIPAPEEPTKLWEEAEEKGIEKGGYGREERVFVDLREEPDIGAGPAVSTETFIGEAEEQEEKTITETITEGGEEEVSEPWQPRPPEGEEVPPPILPSGELPSPEKKKKPTPDIFEVGVEKRYVPNIVERLVGGAGEDLEDLFSGKGETAGGEVNWNLI